ncbi:MAG: YceD family protein [Burkholderiaceae bacterium]
MATREFDPFRLEVQAFAKEAGHLAGRWPLMQLLRVAESALGDAEERRAAEVIWSARGEQRAAPGGELQTWMHVKAGTVVSLECQRCLQPMAVALAVERSFLFVHGEDAAAQLDADSEDDVLALTRSLDLRELVEDELLLAMPIVPRHEVCPVPLPVRPNDPQAEEKPNPFAALAVLKRGGPLN